MSDTKPPEKPEPDVDAIVAEIGEKFHTWGGGKYTPGSVVSKALANTPLAFAGGVSVVEVVKFVLERAK